MCSIGDSDVLKRRRRIVGGFIRVREEKKEHGEIWRAGAYGEWLSIEWGFGRWRLQASERDSVTSNTTLSYLDEHIQILG